MVGVTYRSASARPQNASQKFSFSSPQQPKNPAEDSKQAPSFKDKESYQELFKPLPKPEAVPLLVPFKVLSSSVVIPTSGIIISDRGQVLAATAEREGGADELPPRENQE